MELIFIILFVFIVTGVVYSSLGTNMELTMHGLPLYHSEIIM